MTKQELINSINNMDKIMMTQGTKTYLRFKQMVATRQIKESIGYNKRFLKPSSLNKVQLEKLHLIIVDSFNKVMWLGK